MNIYRGLVLALAVFVTGTCLLITSSAPLTQQWTIGGIVFATSVVLFSRVLMTARVI